MDGIQLRDEAVKDRIRAAHEFLDPNDNRAYSYRADVILMLQQKRRRLVVSIDNIRQHNKELADGLLNQPFDFSQAFDEAVKRVVHDVSKDPKETAEDVVSSVGLWR
jgi:DNA replication licensing factor MCM3